MKRAFSLLELLVVMVILALLAALLFPVLARAKQDANATQCISNLHQLGIAIQAYQGDNNGELPTGDIHRWQNTMGDGTLGPKMATRDVIKSLEAYGSKGVDVCPQMSSAKYVPRWIRNFPSPVKESRLVVPQPSTVLIECHHHLTKGWSGGGTSETYTVAPVSERDGKHLVLHADGSVGKDDAHAVRQYIWEFKGGKEVWEPYDAMSPLGDVFADVFPEEQWPPEWIRLPDFYELNWGRGSG